ncbi:MAG: ribulose-phosphate 3-epimerase [Spirochaetaceae bacterium 4572_59]|nr:MAG: ribulose-phosphate 3-epimerase [Spirochaetaceae bacterium 4572_59]
MDKKILCAPSVLAANFTRIGEEVELIKKAGGDWIHLDVMDGLFVPEITFGAQMVSHIKKVSDLIMDVHLMIERPEEKIPAFIKAGADYITFHIEAVIHAHRLIQLIKEGGAKAGIALVPSTPVSTISELLPFLDQILIMTVNPGYGGQKLIPECLEKVKLLTALKEKKGYNYLISVDGGINKSTIRGAVAAGVDVFVAGSAFFGAEDPVAMVKEMKNC